LPVNVAIVVARLVVVVVVGWFEVILVVLIVVVSEIGRDVVDVSGVLESEAVTLAVER
jgi:hypothetical protein